MAPGGVEPPHTDSKFGVNPDGPRCNETIPGYQGAPGQIVGFRSRPVSVGLVAPFVAPPESVASGWGAAPPLHLHPDTDEAFYVAEGDVTFLLGDREVAVTTGGLVFVPRGTAHTVWNSGLVPVRGLIVISPGDAEHSFVPVDAG